MVNYTAYSEITQAEKDVKTMLEENQHPGPEALAMLETIAVLRDEREILIQERISAQEAAQRAEQHLATAMTVIADYQAMISAMAARQHKTTFPIFPCEAAGKE